MSTAQTTRRRRLSCARTALLGCAELHAPLAAGQDADPVDVIPVEAIPAEPAEPEPRTPQATDVIVVTGELLDRAATHTTSSVAVISGAEIERSAVRDVYDVIRTTPNASLEDSDFGFGGLSLRGIGSYGASGAGAFASYGTTSAVVFDGVGLPRSALGYADLSAFDLDSVEIFRGPQSTSQGRNAMAGAVIINSVAPEPAPGFRPQLRARIGGGSEHGYQGAGAAEATLWPERLAVRMVHDRRGTDGDIFNATRDEDDWARSRSRSTRLRATWLPHGAGGRYSAVLGAADLARFKRSRYVQLEQEAARVSLNDAPTDFDNTARLYALDQRLRLNERWDLRAVSAYIRADTRSRFDNDYGPEDDSRAVQHEKARGFSQELRGTYEGGRLRASLGAYFFNGRDGDVQDGLINVNAALELAGLCGVELVCSLPLGNILFHTAMPAKVEDAALFGELDWAATERLTLTAGLRYDHEKNGRVIRTETTGDSPLATLAMALLRGAGTVAPDGETRVSRSFSEILPRFAARYEVAKGWYLGAAYTEGYRPGGDGYNQISGRHFSFDSERTRNVELSLKGHYASGKLPGKLIFALNLFRTRWEDMQIQGGQGTDTFMENAGLAHVEGGELELRWRAPGSLDIVGGAGLTRGRFDRFVSTEGEDFAGNRLPKAPEYSAVLALEWTPLPGLMIRPDLLWTGATPANADNRPEHALASYRLLNLSVRWRRGRFGLFFTGSNLTDAHYRTDANRFNFQGLDVVGLGEPRRLVGGLEFEL